MFPLVDERIWLEAELEQYGTERNLITTKGGITNRPFTGAARRAGGQAVVVCTFIALVFSLSDNDDVSDDDDEAKGERSG